MIFEEFEFGGFDTAESKARKAYEHYEDGEMVQALDEIDAALELNPSNSSWHFDKALTLDSISRFDDAINEYQAALQLSPNDPEILNSLAVDYTRTGCYDLALETFEQIEQSDPEFEPAYCNRIITYTEMGQHEMAEQMFYMAQQIKPDCALCYYNIGNSLFVRGQYKRAIQCWSRTAQLDPMHPQINYRIAQAHWADGDNELCRERFLAELRNNPGDIDVILDFGLFLLEQDDLESAREKFSRILELQPNFPPALFYLGEVIYESGDHDRAVALFEQALDSDSALAGPGYRLAQHALLQNDIEQAKSYLVSELKRAPESSQALVSMGSMFLYLGEPNYATHCMLRAIDLDSSEADAHYYLGLISATQAMYTDALRFFSHALDINSRHVAALRETSRVYLAMQRLDEADEKASAALTLTPSDSRLKSLQRRIRRARFKRQLSDTISRYRY